MEIQRIDTYADSRFSECALFQHGCFLVEGKPYEIEIISDFINNFDKIMALAKSEENRVLDEYNAMMEEFNVLSQSEQLRKFYVSQNEEKAPVIEEPEQKVIYVDDDGNIIEDIDNYMEKSFNNETDEIDEMLNQIPKIKFEDEDLDNDQDLDFLNDEDEE